MGMGKIRVTSEQLRTTAKEVEGMANEYKTLYTELLQMISDFTSTDFKGKEADEFRNKAYDFEDDFVKMKDLMDEYARHLRMAADNIDQTRDNISGEAASLQS